MDFKNAIEKDGENQQSYTKFTSHATIDTALQEVDNYVHNCKIQRIKGSELSSDLEDISQNEDILNLYNNLSNYWSTFGHLNCCTYRKFCRMLKDHFNVSIVNSQDEE